MLTNQIRQPLGPCAFTAWWRRHVPLHQPPYLQGLVLMMLYALAFAPAFTVFNNSPLRFITYAVPIGNLFIWFLMSPRSLQYDTRFIISLGIYTGLLVFAAFVTMEQFDKFTWINALRPVFYLLMFVPFMLFNLTSLKMLVIMFMVTMALQAVTGSATTVGDFDIAESKGLLESGLAFPLGATLIFCLRYGRKSTTVIVFFLFLAAFKRIAIVAVVLVLGMMVIGRLLSRFTGLREEHLALFTALLFTVAAVMLNLFYHEFFSFIAETLKLNQDINTLTMGRVNEYDILDMQTGDQSLMHILFGGGPGYATRNLIEVTIDYPLQVHNSYLLYYYDFGVIGFFLFMAGFFVVYSRNALGLYLFAYNAFVMITDNSFTHHYHQFTNFILIAIAEYMDNERKAGRPLV